MPRIRTIKPEFPQSESMGRISREARLAFILLWTLADDSGRLRGNSRMLASLLYPYDEDAAKLIDGWLAELDEEGCIRGYVVDGDHYIEISNWLKHQKIDKPSQSKIPPFDEASRIVAKPREHSSGDRDQGIKEGTKDSLRTGLPVAPQINGKEPDPKQSMAKAVFDHGVSLLVAAGKTEAQARSLIGMWRKQAGDDESVLKILVTKNIGEKSDVVAYVTKAVELAAIAKKCVGGNIMNRMPSPAGG